jgi:uncharacterized membrane protein YciS (DUF1049 family)
MEYFILISAFLAINGLVLGWLSFGFWWSERKYKNIKNDKSGASGKEKIPL